MFPLSFRFDVLKRRLMIVAFPFWTAAPFRFMHIMVLIISFESFRFRPFCFRSVWRYSESPFEERLIATLSFAIHVGGFGRAAPEQSKAR